MKKKLPDRVFIALGKRLSDAVDDVQRNPYPPVTFKVLTTQKYDVVVTLEPVFFYELRGEL